MPRPMIFGTLGFTMSISKFMKDPSSVGILTGIVPKLSKTLAFLDDLGLNRTQTISRYVYDCCFSTTDCWSPESKQAPWNDALRIDFGRAKVLTL